VESISHGWRIVDLSQCGQYANANNYQMDLHVGTQKWFSRNEEIFGEGEPVEYIYTVKSDCVRTFNTISDGRRQVGSFYLSGEYFGLEGENRHSFSAEAVERSKVYVLEWPGSRPCNAPSRIALGTNSQAFPPCNKLAKSVI
jgi:hypothetical protein